MADISMGSRWNFDKALSGDRFQVIAWILYGIVLLPFFYFALTHDFLASGWTPDTKGYVELHAYRQPLYGFFFRGLSSVGFSEGGIGRVQLALFGLSVLFLVHEAVRVVKSPLIIAPLVLAWWFPLFTYMLPLSVSFISEALFYPVLTLFSASLLRYARSGGKGCLALAAITAVFLVCIRSAALAVLPVILAILAFAAFFAAETVRRDARIALLVSVMGAGLVPMLFGRMPWDLQPQGDVQGFVLLPRIVMLSAPLDLPPLAVLEWSRLNQSFISAAEPLTCVERALFESQLQEAVRYYIGPKLLLAGKSLTPEVQASAEGDATQERASDLFQQAVRNDPLSYSASSLCHLWGMLSAGTHAGTASRLAVFKALTSVDPETWELADFRTDYPLNNYSTPLKRHTEIVYGAFRLLALAGSMAGIIMSLWVAFHAAVGKRPLQYEGLSVWLLTGALLGHSLVVALTVFPEPRYILGNFILQWALLAVALRWLRFERDVG